MTMPARPSMPIELVHCIAEDRAPTYRELTSVAQHIWLGCTVRPPVHGWNQLSHDSPDRLAAFRLARLALYGTSDMHTRGHASLRSQRSDLLAHQNLITPALRPPYADYLGKPGTIGS